MSDIKFDIYESPANDGEKKKYHVRNTNKQTIHSKDLIHETTLYTSVSRSDWAAVVEGLIDILSEKLGDGKRIHINGLGYFSVSIGSTESENPKKMTRGTVQITGINFQPEKSFKKSIINRMHGNCLIPILVNPLQGLKKSTFCRSLLPPALRGYYTDDFDVTREGDALRKMRSLALINIDEFNRMEEGKLARLKNLVQMSGLSMRRPFQSSYSQQPRLSSFIGTSNFCDLLTDSSGNRRFYPVMTKGSIRLPRINYKQLYAQLRDELKHNRRYWLSPTEEQAVSLRNDAFLRRPIEESLFYSCFSLPQDGEKFQRWTIGQIYDCLLYTSPSPRDA